MIIKLNFILFLSLAANLGFSQEVADQVTFGEYSASTYSYNPIESYYSDEGRQRLERSKFKVDYYQLAHFFSPQIHPNYCGIASSTIVLNALRVPSQSALANPKIKMTLPEVWGGGTKEFHFYTQETFFNEDTDKVKSKTLVRLENVTEENTQDESAFSPGLTLSELGQMLSAYDLKAQVIYASTENGEDAVDSFRKTVKNVLSEQEKFIIVNILGEPLGLNSKGHISPIAAYDEESDSVLMLEVAAVKRPWLWIPLKDLYLSMATKDGQKNRGFIIVEEGISKNP